MILERYLIREIVRPAVATCGLLVFMFGCYMATRYWADAAQGELPGFTVMVLILLRVVIALEVLIPTTLFLSVVIALNRLYRNSEITALAACGIGPGRIFKSVAIASALAAVLVAILSLYIRPWAWNQFFTLKTEERARFDLTRMKGGIFYEIWHGRRVMFAQSVDLHNKTASNVFIYTNKDDERELISASSAKQYAGPDGRPYLMLLNGCQYEYAYDGSRSMMIEFERSRMILEPPVIEKEDKIKAVPLLHLLGGSSLEEIAELQWRFITPLSTLLLALLGVPLGVSTPRQTKSASMPVAITVFALYYLLAALLKKWVAQGQISPVPGIWWSQVFLVVLLALFLKKTGMFGART